MSDEPVDGIGERELIAMKEAGWKFWPNAVRLRNGWLMMAVNGKGEHRNVLVSDPEDEPDKWPGIERAGQLELSLEGGL